MKTQAAEIDPELVSALADGQLQGNEFASTVDYVGAFEDARLTWQTYHLVGDVLREGEALAAPVSTDFMARLRVSLDQELPLRPDQRMSVSLPPVKSLTANPTSPAVGKQKSANDSWFRWKLLAGAASLATVAMIAWQAVGGAGSSGAQLAAINASITNPVTAVDVATGPLSGAPSDQAQVMIRDPELDALLAAHRQFGGTSALQMPAGFLRNATFEGAVR